MFSARQNLMIRANLLITQKLGPWDKGIGEDGAHYMSPAQNPFQSSGLACHNCAFWREGGGCTIVNGNIEREGLCKLWVISEDRLRRGPAALQAGRPRTLEAVK